jgi:hypothetical protein
VQPFDPTPDLQDEPPVPVASLRSASLIRYLIAIITFTFLPVLCAASSSGVTWWEIRSGHCNKLADDLRGLIDFLADVSFALLVPGLGMVFVFSLLNPALNFRVRTALIFAMFLLTAGMVAILISIDRLT